MDFSAAAVPLEAMLRGGFEANVATKTDWIESWVSELGGFFSYEKRPLKVQL